MIARSRRPAFATLVLLALSGCGSSAYAPTTASSTSAVEPAAEPDAVRQAAPTTGSSAPPSQGCTLRNTTDRTLVVEDTAIDEPLGELAPGATLQVGGHFAARAEGLAAHGFCSSAPGEIRIVEREGGLHALSPDGSPSTEGEGE